MKFEIRPAILSALLYWGLCGPAMAAGYFVTNAGFNGNPQYLGDGGSAQIASMITPGSMVADAAGNIYVNDVGAYVVRKIDTNGIATTYAGTGVQGYSGDGGPATSAKLGQVWGLAMDAAGNLYVADASNYRIRKVDTAGTITTFAGIGTQGVSGNGGAATAAALSSPQSIVFDAIGNMYIADGPHIRMINTAGTISSFASNVFAGGGINDIAIDSANNLYASDGSSVVRQITQAGVNSIFAGTFGMTGATGDGGPATSAKLYQPRGITVDAGGTLFIVDASNYTIRAVSGGIINTVAGITGMPGFGGSGVAALSTQINYVPTRIAVAPNGDILYGDSGRVRRLSLANLTPPVITTLALPGGVVGTAYANSVVATGSAPISWSMTSGTLPPGLSFSPTGALQGTPAAAGSYTFVLAAYNGATINTIQNSYTIVISATPLPSFGNTPNVPINFSSQVVGVTTATQSFIIFNDGSSSFQLTSIGSSSVDFAVTTGQNCPAFNVNFLPGAACTLNVTFTPTATGFRSAQITVNTTGTGSHLLNVNGFGTASALTASLAFNPVTITAQNMYSSLVLTLTNPNAVAATGTAFNLAYPAGLLNSAIVNTSYSCVSGGTLTATSLSGGFSGSGLTIPANGSCIAQVSVGPVGSVGSYPVSLAVGGLSSTNLPANTAGATGTLTVVAAGGPAFSSTPAANVVFSGQPQGLMSLLQQVAVTNSGGAAMTISSIVATNPDYTLGGSCPSSLAAGASCIITVTITPSHVGVDNGVLLITDSAPGSPHGLSLFGTGLTPITPLFSPSPIALNFPLRAVGTTSSQAPISISNAGINTLNITSITVSGDFAVQPGNCNVAFAASCSMTVTFSPTGAGTRTGAITFVSNAPGSPHTITLSGTGLGAAQGPVASLSPATLNFALQSAGTTSVAQRSVLTNAGNGPMTIASVYALGDFGFVSDCPLAPATLAATASCNVDVTFSPITGGLQSAFVYVNDNAPGGPHVIALSGQGIVTAIPSITVSPRSLTFADRVVGSLGPSQTITVSNTGQANLNLTSITVNGAAFQRIVATPASSDCGTVVAPQASCLIAIVFGPGAVGAASGSVVINHNVSTAPVTVALSGNGTPVPQALIRFAIQFDFGDQVIGTQSAAKTLTIFNVGTAPLSISAIVLAGANANEFATGGDCVTTVAAGASCAMTIRFTPASTGEKVAELDITSNAADAAVGNKVQLGGNGVPVPKPVVRVSATTLGFGNVIYGGVPASRGISVSNVGTGPLTIIDIVIDGNRDFAQTNNCGSGVAAQSQCSITITFAPHGIGARSGVLTIRSNADNSPHQVQLGGSGCHYYSPTAARLFAATC